MALFKIFKGLSDNLPALSTSKDGYCYFTTDDALFYIDYADANGTLRRKVLNASDALTLMGATLVDAVNNSEFEIPTSKAVYQLIASIDTQLANLNDDLDDLRDELASKSHVVIYRIGEV